MQKNYFKIVTPPQIIPKEFYEYFGVINQLEFPNYYEIIIIKKYRMNSQELKYWLRVN